MVSQFISIIFILVTLQQGILYALLATGIYITFRILDLPDLTVDGSFVLGMAVTAIITIQGAPFLSLALAFVCGILSGSITGLLQTKIGINPILSGILVMTSLYSINLFLMGGKSNISLVGKDTIFNSYLLIPNVFTYREDLNKVVIGCFLVLLICAILILFFKTRLGLSIRATGDNEDMVRASSINGDFTKCFGLALGNGLVALTGGLIAQFNSSADITSGTGMMVIGLASIIIGESFFGKKSVTKGFISSILGSIIYWFIIAFALKVNILPAYTLKLISSFIVLLALILPRAKERIYNRKRKKGLHNVN